MPYSKLLQKIIADTNYKNTDIIKKCKEEYNIPSLTLLKEYKVCNAVDKCVTDFNSVTEKCVIFLIF